MVLYSSRSQEAQEASTCIDIKLSPVNHTTKTPHDKKVFVCFWSCSPHNQCEKKWVKYKTSPTTPSFSSFTFTIITWLQPQTSPFIFLIYHSCLRICSTPIPLIWFFPPDTHLALSLTLTLLQIFVQMSHTHGETYTHYLNCSASLQHSWYSTWCYLYGGSHNTYNFSPYNMAYFLLIYFLFGLPD